MGGGACRCAATLSRQFTHEILTPARHQIASTHYALVFDSGRPLFARNGYVKGSFLPVMISRSFLPVMISRSFLPVMISRIILPLSLDCEGVGMLLLGHTFASPTAEEQMAPGTDGVVDGDEYEFLEGPPNLALVPPPRIAAAC